MSAVKRAPTGKPRGRPRKKPVMADTPKNVVLTPSTPIADADEKNPGPVDTSNEYPKVLYHKDSKVGALLSKLVATPEEAEALGDEWGSLAALQIETAPPEGH